MSRAARIGIFTAFVVVVSFIVSPLLKALIFRFINITDASSGYVYMGAGIINVILIVLGFVLLLPKK